MAPRLTDAELVTLSMMQAMAGFTSEARWLRHARAHLRHLFPYLPQQPGYNKRLRNAVELLRRHTLRQPPYELFAQHLDTAAAFPRPVRVPVVGQQLPAQAGAEPIASASPEAGATRADSSASSTSPRTRAAVRKSTSPSAAR